MGHLQKNSFWLNQHASTVEHKFDAIHVRDFHRALPGYQPTPLIDLPDLAEELGVKNVLLKDESSRLGLPAFKIMGASWGVFRAVAAEVGLSIKATMQDVGQAARTRSMVLLTATDGNHGRAVAFMAKLLGLSAICFVPDDMGEHTKQVLIGEGATVVESGDYDRAVIDAADAASTHTGGILVQDTGFEGYEEIPTWIVEGYSTIFHEVDSELAKRKLSVDLVVTPVGVGSLAHSVVRHYRTPSLNAAVVAVEPVSAACLNTSLQAGIPLVIQTSSTIMAGMNCGTVSLTAWDDLCSSINASITVSDMEAHEAVQYLEARHIQSGPCGASGVAALRHLASSYRIALGLHKDSTVLLLNTEGRRPYIIPPRASCGG